MQGKVDATGIREFPGVDGVRWRDSFFLNVLLQLRYTVEPTHIVTLLAHMKYVCLTEYPPGYGHR